MAKTGERGKYHDRRGVPIYPGDLLKTDHFVERLGRTRRRRHYLYHTVVEEDGVLWIVPTSHLEPTKVNQGGKCRLRAIDAHEESEVIAGHGPGECIDFRDRPRLLRPEPAEAP